MPGQSHQLKTDFGEMKMRSLYLAFACMWLIGCGTEPQAPLSSDRAIPIEQGNGNSGTPDLMPRDPGEREVPGTFTDEPSGSPDLSDPNIDTSVMPR